MPRKKIPMTVKHLFGETTVNLSATLYKTEGESTFPLLDEFLGELGFNIK